jgi:serine/threonine protein kinase
MAFASGTHLGPYEILMLLGRGGMGEVYRGRDPRLNREIAIKVLPAALSQDSERLHRFEQEARAAALNHPNIVTIHSVEVADAIPFLTMELVDGRPLADLIPKGGMVLNRLLAVATPIADALAAAHAKGITHRDLKPANIMVAPMAGRRFSTSGWQNSRTCRPSGPASVRFARNTSRSKPALSAPLPICRPSKRKASRSIRDRTFSRWASSSMKWRPANVRSRETRPSRRSRAFFVIRPGRSLSSITRCREIWSSSRRDALSKILSIARKPRKISETSSRISRTP